MNCVASFDELCYCSFFHDYSLFISIYAFLGQMMKNYREFGITDAPELEITVSE